MRLSYGLKRAEDPNARPPIRQGGYIFSLIAAGRFNAEGAEPTESSPSKQNNGPLSELAACPAFSALMRLGVQGSRILTPSPTSFR